MCIIDKTDALYHEAGHLIVALILDAPVEYLKIIESKTSKPIKYDESQGRLETIQETTYDQSYIYIPSDYNQGNPISDIIIRMSGIASEIILIDKNHAFKEQILANHEDDIITTAINKMPDSYRIIIHGICGKTNLLQSNIGVSKYPIDSKICKDAGGDKGMIEKCLNQFPAPLKELIGNISWTIALQLIEIYKSYIKNVVEDLDRMKPVIHNGDYYPSYNLEKEYITKLKFHIINSI